jgi:rhodanese-related sulfurtransferase
LLDALNQVSQIPKDNLVYLLCAAGVRSSMLAEELSNNHGFTKLRVIEGGFSRWLAANQPLKVLTFTKTEKYTNSMPTDLFSGYC